MEQLEEGTVRIKDAYGELKVSTALLGEIREAIELIHPAMDPEGGYTTEMLVGPEIWNRYGSGGHRFIGRCVAWMVRKRLIPIQRITPVGSGTALYSR